MAGGDGVVGSQAGELLTGTSRLVRLPDSIFFISQCLVMLCTWLEGRLKPFSLWKVTSKTGWIQRAAWNVS